MSGSALQAPLFVQRIIVGVGDLAVSDNAEIVLSTYALGSCIGVVAFDEHARVGGMLHLMLPDSGIAPDRVARQPAMFADTGLELFARELIGVRAERERLRLVVAGGANVLCGPDPFRIGERNTRVTLDFLDRHGYAVRHTSVGGGVNRALHLELASGTVTLKTPLEETRFSLAL